MKTNGIRYPSVRPSGASEQSAGGGYGAADLYDGEGAGYRRPPLLLSAPASIPVSGTPMKNFAQRLG